MKENIQHKVNRILEIANKNKSETTVTGKSNTSVVMHTNDSLLKSIRNKEEADVFLAELDAVIALSQKKSDNNIHQ